VLQALEVAADRAAAIEALTPGLKKKYLRWHRWQKLYM